MARKPGQLTDKQARFVREYLIDLNATQAAIRAGYSERTAEVQGPRLLGNVRVSTAIHKAQAKQADKLEISAARVLKEYARIAFADIRNVARVATFPGMDGSESMAVMIAASEDWGDEAAAAVAEVSSSQHGPRLKLHDKQHALDALSKHLGLFKADNEQKTPDLTPVAVALEERLAKLGGQA